MQAARAEEEIYVPTTRCCTARKQKLVPLVVTASAVPNVITRRHPSSGVVLGVEFDWLAIRKGQKELSNRRNGSELSAFIDVSSYAEAIGFLVPVYMSPESWQTFVEVDDDIPQMSRNPRMKERRLLEILLRGLHVARGAQGEEIALFDMYRLTSRMERKNTGKVAICKQFRVRCDLDGLGKTVVIIEFTKRP